MNVNFVWTLNEIDKDGWFKWYIANQQKIVMKLNGLGKSITKWNEMKNLRFPINI